MSKITAPLLSFDARGQIGKSMVFGDWRGVQYARRYVVPANPQSTAQTLTRDIFRNLEDLYKVAGPLQRAPWTRFAVGQRFVGRNAYVGQNIAAMRGEANMQLFVGSPGAKGGLSPTSIATTPAAGQITVDFTNPAAPTGWTLVSAIAIAFPDQAPEAQPAPAITEGEDATTQIQVVLTGLGSGLHVVSAWLEWTKADGSTAYGASINDTATTP